MAEKSTAFKHWISSDVVKKYSIGLKKINPHFNEIEFLKIQKQLPALELKQRVELIAKSIHLHGNTDYKKSLTHLLKACEIQNMNGFELWPATHYIQIYGTAYIKESLDALYILTQKFTAEFAIRPFINKYHTQIHAELKKWIKDPNVHIRRWISEGTRPKLPWGEKLPALIKDPTPNLELLEILKFDKELYVRKSVSNHLNDITKEHPNLVVKILNQWSKECPLEFKNEFNFIVKQALRTLIKKGDPSALKLIGVSANNPDLKIKTFKISNQKVRLNSKLHLTFILQNNSHKKLKFVLDYVIFYQKSNGQLAPKVFKLKTAYIDPKAKIQFNKIHNFKAVTTRKHYNGVHEIGLLLNGNLSPRLKFILYGI